MQTAEEYFRGHRLRYFHTLTKKQVIELMESYVAYREGYNKKQSSFFEEDDLNGFDQ